MGRASLINRSPRGFAVRLSALGFLTLLFLSLGLASAYAATFDRNLILSDDNMRAVNSMSASDIQAFLDVQPGVLKSLVTTDYAGVPKPASQIIYEASQQWGISPKVMLTMLQKEQSLLTRTSLAANTLSRAIGAGCPNSTTNYYPGFGQQMWFGAQLLSAYGEGVARYTIRNGVEVKIPYSDVAFTYGMTITDSYRTPPVVVTPGNLATYKLYIYNPSVGASEPYGDLSTQSCSGNANFWKIYWKYFDDPFGNPRVLPIYRFYNMKTGSHFYTASETERYTVIKKYPTVYKFEGIAYSTNTANTANSVPLYRFYNVKTGTHFYTASEDEKNSVLAKWPTIFKLEGVAYYVSSTTENATPIYRFYNKKNGTHFYTASADEKNTVIAKWPKVYTFEGIGYYIGN
ncbi:MAG: hypothetical protein AB2L09_03825 [Coriobacteriia bacterium]